MNHNAGAHLPENNRVERLGFPLRTGPLQPRDQRHLPSAFSIRGSHIRRVAQPLHPVRCGPRNTHAGLRPVQDRRSFQSPATAPEEPFQTEVASRYNDAIATISSRHDSEFIFKFRHLIVALTQATDQVL